MCGTLNENAKKKKFQRGSGTNRRLPGKKFAKLWCISFTGSLRPGSD